MSTLTSLYLTTLPYDAALQLIPVLQVKGLDHTDVQMSAHSIHHTGTVPNTAERREENDSHFTFYSDLSACLPKFSDDLRSTLILYMLQWHFCK